MKQTQEELAEKYGISSRTLRNYKSAGVDIHNEAAVKAYMELNTMYDYTDNSLLGLDSSDLKKRKQAADIKDKEARAAITEIELQKLQGTIVDIEDVVKANMKIAGRVKAKLKKLILEIPPQAEGLTSVKISQLVRTKVDEILEQLYEELNIEDVKDEEDL
jgi:transcriptional regulator with XRE-family HTH domain